MINKRELRIGNLVKVINTIIEVTEIQSRGINPNWDSYKHSYDDLQPIALTEEILEKLSLEKFDRYYSIYKNWELVISKEGNKYIVDNIDGDISHDDSDYKIRFLHQLQNIYYILNRKELNVSKLLN